MNKAYYEIYERTNSREDSPEMQKAEAALADLLRHIENRELRDAIDRAVGTLSRLREAEGFEAGCHYAQAEK